MADEIMRLKAERRLLRGLARCTATGARFESGEAADLMRVELALYRRAHSVLTREIMRLARGPAD